MTEKLVTQKRGEAKLHLNQIKYVFVNNKLTATAILLLDAHSRHENSVRTSISFSSHSTSNISISINSLHQKSMSVVRPEIQSQASLHLITRSDKKVSI